jgi:type II secretory pathway component PulC
LASRHNKRVDRQYPRYLKTNKNTFKTKAHHAALIETQSSDVAKREKLVVAAKWCSENNSDINAAEVFNTLKAAVVDKKKTSQSFISPSTQKTAFTASQTRDGKIKIEFNPKAVSHKTEAANLFKEIFEYFE